MDRWNIERNRTIELINLGNMEEAMQRNTDFGIEERLEKDILSAIQNVNDFASAKMEELFPKLCKT